jgi:predicted alpha/beta hydrolase
MKKITVIAPDGFPLSALFGEPTRTARGIIVISAATGVRKEFYINFARFLIDNSYRVLLYDYRGIGESAAGDIKASLVYMHEWGTKDMNGVLNYLTVTCGFKDIIWLGHSIGAQLVGLLEKKRECTESDIRQRSTWILGILPVPDEIGCMAVVARHRSGSHKYLWIWRDEKNRLG